MRLLLIFALIGQAAFALPRAPLTPFEVPKRAKNISFAETLERYPSPYAVLQQFKFIFPDLEDFGTYDDCRLLNKDMAPVVGTIDPLQGGALEEEPGALFYAFFENCVRTIGKNALTSTGTMPRFSDAVLGTAAHAELIDSLSRYCLKSDIRLPIFCNNGGGEYQFWRFTPWVEVPVQIRYLVLSRFLRRFNGPDAVLRSRHLIGEETVWGEAIPSASALVQRLDQAMLPLRNGDGDPLNVREVYVEIAILLSLGPALKN